MVNDGGDGNSVGEDVVGNEALSLLKGQLFCVLCFDMARICVLTAISAHCRAFWVVKAPAGFQWTWKSHFGHGFAMEGVNQIGGSRLTFAHVAKTST